MTNIQFTRLAALISLTAACSSEPPRLSAHRMQIVTPVDVPEQRAFECAPTPAGTAESIGVFADGRDVLATYAADGCRGAVGVRNAGGTVVEVLPGPAFYIAAAGATVDGHDVVCATRALASPLMVGLVDEAGAPGDVQARGSSGLLYTIDTTEVVCRAQGDGGAWGPVRTVDVLVDPPGEPVAQWVSAVNAASGQPAVVVLVDSKFDPGRLTTTGRPGSDGFWNVGLARAADGTLAVGARSLLARPDLRKFACADQVTCEELGVECGQTLGACGQILDCGGCAGGEVCGAGGAGQCGTGTCVAKTCAELGASCGEVSDGCGGVLECGDCAGAGEECGGGGAANVCACIPKTCEQLGKNCGVSDDGCGATIACGFCTGDPGAPFDDPNITGDDQSPGTCGGGGVRNVCGSLDGGDGGTGGVGDLAEAP